MIFKTGQSYIMTNGSVVTLIEIDRPGPACMIGVISTGQPFAFNKDGKVCFCDIHHSFDLVSQVEPISRNDAMTGALEWYAEKLHNVNRMGDVGNAARNALAKDGGHRARSALAIEV